MKNLKIAQILYQIADLLEIQEVEFKPVAYRRAAQSIENLSEPIEEYAKEGKLDDIPGVGKGIASKIEEILKTGSCQELKKLKKQVPIDVENLLQVEGVGPKTIKILYKKLHIKNLKDLEQAAQKGKISTLEHFGKKTEEQILQGLEFVKKSTGRFLLGDIYPLAEELKSYLKQKSSCVELAGSLRRFKETIGDLDILAVGDKKIVDHFVQYKDVKKVLWKGPSKASVVLENGLQVDLRMISKELFGAGLMYFIGSKEHSIALRKIAIKKGYKLSEYGLFKGKRTLAAKTEKDIYSRLGMEYIDPELRENTGEIEAAQQKKLPSLVTLQDVKGDLHMHSTWSDGNNSIQELAEACKKKGYDYLAITDHFGNLRIANSLNRKRIVQQWEEIDSLNKKLEKFTILKGAEVNIKLDGSLDIDPLTLKELDYVIASIHGGFKNNVTSRIQKAMENPFVCAVAHPSGRLLNRREGTELDYEKLFATSLKTGTFFEINSSPERLDLDSVHAKEAIMSGCKLLINTDAHSLDSLNFMRLGVGTARRGWCEHKHVLNTLSLTQLQKVLKK